MKYFKQINSSLALSSTILVFITIAQKALGFFREVLFADKFGLSEDFDLFLVAISLIFTFNTAFFYIIQHYFVPIYSSYKIESNERANDFFINTTVVILFIGFLVLIIFLLFTDFILKFFIPNDNKILLEKANLIFKIYSITIPFSALISVFSAHHQSNSEYFYPALIQTLINIIVIILILFYTHFLNIFVIPVSFVLAYAIAALVMLIRARKFFSSISLFNPKNWIKLDFKLNFFFLILIEIFSLSYTLVDRIFFKYLPSGSIAALNYALNIYSIPIAIFSLPLLTVLFPRFSKAINEGTDFLNYLFEKSTLINLIIFLPISFVLIVYSEFFVRILFERGEFSSMDTKLTAQALSMYSYSMVFYSIYLIVVKLFYTFNKYSIVTYLAFGSIISKVILNFILVFHFSHEGLAISTSAVYFILFTFGLLLTKQFLKDLNLKKLLFDLTLNFLSIVLIFLMIIILRKIVLLNSLQTIFEIIMLFSLYLVNLKIIRPNYLNEIFSAFKIIRY